VLKRAYSRHVPSSHPDEKEECGEPPCDEFIGEGAGGALNLVETKDDVVLIGISYSLLWHPWCYLKGFRKTPCRWAVKRHTAWP